MQTEAKPVYLGSSKHKNRPADEMKGTFCPEWTHTGPRGGFATDVHAQDWKETPAARIFAGAEIDPDTGRRYATERGIAFEAKPTGDGTWHGCPVPWESVPQKLRSKWKEQGAVAGRQIKAFLRFDKRDLFWALETDDR